MVRGAALPSHYLLQIVELGQQWGISESQMLAGTGISSTLLHNVDARVPLTQCTLFGMNMLRLSERPGFGFDLGLHLKITSHGSVGYAVMSAGSLREAGEVAIQYADKLWGAIQFETKQQGDHVEFRLVENVPLGPFRAFCVEAILTLLWNHQNFVTGGRAPDCEIHMPWPEPDYFKDYASRLPVVRWDQESAMLLFPSTYLDEPLQLADPRAKQKALSDAQREFSALGDSPENLLRRVEELLKPSEHGFPSVNDVAKRLHLSERSLKRKLNALGTTYRNLLQVAMSAEAERLMFNPDLDLQDISTRLGYEDPATFTHAFKRWTGHTPSSYRKALLEQTENQ